MSARTTMVCFGLPIFVFVLAPCGVPQNCHSSQFFQCRDQFPKSLLSTLKASLSMSIPIPRFVLLPSICRPEYPELNFNCSCRISSNPLDSTLSPSALSPPLLPTSIDVQPVLLSVLEGQEGKSKWDCTSLFTILFSSFGLCGRMATQFDAYACFSRKCFSEESSH